MEWNTSYENVQKIKKDLKHIFTKFLFTSIRFQNILFQSWQILSAGLPIKMPFFLE